MQLYCFRWYYFFQPENSMKNSRRKCNKNIYLEKYSALSLLSVGDITQDLKQMPKSEKGIKHNIGYYFPQIHRTNKV